MAIVGSVSSVANASVVSYELQMNGAGADVTAIDVTVATADVVISKEGLAGAGSISTLDIPAGDDNPSTEFQPDASEFALYIKTDVTVQNGDFVYVTFPGAAFDTTGANPELSMLTVVNAAGNDDDIDTPDSNLSFIKYEGDSIVFGATAAVNAGSILALDNVTLKSTSAASIAPTFRAVNTVIGDYATGTAKKALKQVSEFSDVDVTANTGALDGVIDVSQDRLEFTTGKTDALGLDLALTPVDKLPISTVSFDLTLNGDFTSLDTDSDNKLEAGEGSITASSGTVTAAADLSSVTIEGMTAATPATITITVPGASAEDAKMLAKQSFTYSITSDYTATSAKSDVKVITDASAGAWTLNGSVVKIPYMPFGDNTQVVLRLTNTSSKSGDMSVRYILEDGQDSWKSLGVVSEVSAGLTDISSMVMDAVKADAGATKGKVALEITTNVPKDSVDVTALFKVLSEQDRAVMAAEETAN